MSEPSATEFIRRHTGHVEIWHAGKFAGFIVPTECGFTIALGEQGPARPETVVFHWTGEPFTIAFHLRETP